MQRGFVVAKQGDLAQLWEIIVLSGVAPRAKHKTGGVLSETKRSCSTVFCLYFGNFLMVFIGFLGCSYCCCESKIRLPSQKKRSRSRVDIVIGHLVQLINLKMTRKHNKPIQVDWEVSPKVSQP